jgi:hypothetical protein
MNPSKEVSASNNMSEFHIISESEFRKCTLEWTKQVSSTIMSWDLFRRSDDQGVSDMLGQVYFNDATVQNLLSSVGVEKINARFVIVNDYEPYGITSGAFTLVLYASDSQGKRCSAYHLGRPQYDYAVFFPEKKQPQDIGDFISSRLAQRWINDWKTVCHDHAKIPGSLGELFLTSYGYLNGYNYIMSDFMYTLFPPGTQIINHGVVVLPVIHKHVLSDHEGLPVWQQTFGLVLAGVEPDTTNQLLNSRQVVNSFYDLSLPTPPQNN